MIDRKLTTKKYNKYLKRKEKMRNIHHEISGTKGS
jgi:hypothetical protein